MDFEPDYLENSRLDDHEYKTLYDPVMQNLNKNKNTKKILITGYLTADINLAIV